MDRSRQMQQDYWGGRSLDQVVPARGKPSRAAKKPNLSFIDWTNEYEAVLDHAAMLNGNSYTEQGLSYEDCPYFDVPYQEVRFLFETGEEGAGLKPRDIARLPRYRGTVRDCSICMEKSADGLILPCRHVFHRKCVERWLQSNPT